MPSRIYMWNGFLKIIYVSGLHYFWISFQDYKGMLQHICYSGMGRLDHCSQFFILPLNRITLLFHVTLQSLPLEWVENISIPHWFGAWLWDLFWPIKCQQKWKCASSEPGPQKAVFSLVLLCFCHLQWQKYASGGCWSEEDSETLGTDLNSGWSSEPSEWRPRWAQQNHSHQHSGVKKNILFFLVNHCDFWDCLLCTRNWLIQGGVVFDKHCILLFLL